MGNENASNSDNTSPLGDVALQSISGRTFHIDKATQLSQIARWYLDVTPHNSFVVAGVVYSATETAYSDLGSKMREVIYTVSVASSVQRSIYYAVEQWIAGGHTRRIGVVQPAPIHTGVSKTIRNDTIPDLRRKLDMAAGVLRRISNRECDNPYLAAYDFIMWLDGQEQERTT